MDVVLVESNLVTARSLSAWFKGTKHRCDVFTSPESALEFLRSIEGDSWLVLLDYGTCSRILSDFLGISGMRFIVMSGHVIPRDHLGLVHDEADYFISKPVDLDELGRALRRFA